MNSKPLISRWPLIATAGLAVLLSACADSGGASGSSGETAVDSGSELQQLPAQQPTAEQTPTQPLAVAAALNDNDFTFPGVIDNNGTLSVSPEGPVPTFSARRTLTAGSGETIAFGDPVVLRYTMYAWSTGVQVETSDDFEDAVTVRAGITGNSPEYLSNSLLGRRIGDRVQVVLKSGTEDLPGGFDTNDAYVVIADLL